MPELPEVETVKNIINPLIKGKTISNIEIYYNRLIQSDINDFKEKLINKTFLNVTRYGKFLFLHLSDNLVIISHLRMEGKFRFSKESNPRYKHTSLTFFFNDSTSLSFDDTRKFGLMYLSDEENYKKVKMIAKLGIEANQVEVSDFNYLATKLRKRKPIKELLLDQSIMCGIGNIYADEILYESKINPFTKGILLTDQNILDIIKNSKIILDKAIKLGGSTIHSFHPSEGVDGRFQEVLMCYGKAGKICPICGTTFHKSFIGGRGTTYCPNCQIDPELNKAIGITGPIGSGKSTILNYLKSKNFNTFSCDEMIHELYEDKTISNKISNILGVPFDINDASKKQKARDIMTKFPSVKNQVENYIYPILENELIKIVKENENVVIEAPTLFKAHIEYLFKTILVIEISNEQQVKNLLNRNENPAKAQHFNKDCSFESKNNNIKIIKATGNFNTLFKQVDDALNIH